MTDDDSRKDPVPSQVGTGSNRYNIVKSGHLGSGHFGDVYLAHHITSGMKVAVKLEHRSGSIAHREWEVMSSMGGDGAPRVYWTGRSGRYYIMVMDLLGATLQRLLESRPQKRLPWDIVASIGYKCVELLEKLHSKGYVHGDVKPENFLCSYSPDTTNSSGSAAAAGNGNMDVKNGLYMVDLGLASRWRDLTRSSGHIQYGQRVDHFSGTVRYASVNAHLGRWLSRRDDLESLAYMMLYLYNGSLPWQGFAGDEKNMKVCERKGMFTVDTLCNNAPEVMQYFLAYVRNMRFEERPDYDYLLLLCQPGTRGIRAVQRLITQQNQNSGGNGTNANGPTGNAGSGALAGSKRGRGSDSTPTGKRHKVVMPKTIKTSQWIIVSTSSRSSNSPLTQCYTSHTTYANLVTEVEAKWANGMRITSLNFAGSMWTAVLNAKNSGYSEQALHYCHETEFPRDWVRAKWEEGYFITSVAGSEDSWGVVCSTMTRGKKYRQQSYIVSSTFPSKWISEKWNSEYFITSIATQGRMNMHWCVVMSRGSPYQQQCVELDFQYPSQSIHARWDENYMITSVACTEDQCAFVMSRGNVYGEEQRCTRTSHGPLHKIREDWADLLFVSCLAFGRVS